MDGSTISIVSVFKGAQHHGGDLLRRIICMQDSPCIGSTHEPVVLLGGQQHELALAAPGNLDRPAISSLDDLARSVAKVGEGKVFHRDVLNPE